MKHSIIPVLVAGLFAGAATAVLAADEAVKSEPLPAESSQSRAADPAAAPDSMNDKTKSGMHDKGDAMFKKADKNNDGTLDRTEAKKMPRISKNFDAIDTDKDGTVSLDEVHTYMSAHPSKNGKM
ncbi:MAG TPA: EF-hand domain-containing protein [Burkholderiales bacterium]|nr:EF-hand domain-containing protein [Burkholderiales bacterium]